MAKGRDQHQAHIAAVAGLGRVLTRRASSRCELCEDRNDLRPTEIKPVLSEPDPEHAALLCARCRGLVDGGPLSKPFADLRFLETAMWSETIPVQVAAVRLLRRVAAAGVDWASDANDTLWLSDEVVERIDG